MFLHSSRGGQVVLLLTSIFGAVGVHAAPVNPAGTTTINVYGTSLPVIVVNQIIDGQCAPDETGSSLGPTATGTLAIPQDNSEHGCTECANAGSASESASSPAPASTILAPAVHPSCDTSQVSNLVPSTQQQFYHAEVSGQDNNSVAIVSVPQMNYPTVQLLESQYISSVQCTSTDAVITFNNQQAFETAISEWSTNENTLLVAYHEGCGNSSSSLQNEYLLVTSLTANSGALTIDLKITVTDFAHAVDQNTNITISLGSYSPTGSVGFNATASNSTNPTNQTGTDGIAPGPSSYPSSSTEHNGTNDFDTQLDAKIGTTSLDNPSMQAQFFPSTSGITEAELQSGANAGPPRRLRKVKRRRRMMRHSRIGFEKRWGFFDWIEETATNVWDTVSETVVSVVDDFADAASSALDAVGGFFGDAVDAIESAAEEAYNTIDRWTSINQSLQETVSVNEYPDSDTTPWGPGIQLYNSDQISAYCVGCGVNGQITLSGAVSFSISSGFNAGNIGANGNLHGDLYLGVVANFEKTFELPTQTVANFALSDLVLPGIFEVGPYVELDVGGNVGVHANGQLLAGVALDWNAVSANLDIIGGGSSADGFTPSVEPRFEANGQVGLSAETFLNLKIGLEVGILEGRFSVYVALVDTPGVHVSADFQGEASYDNGQISAGFTGDCSGVELGAYVYNKLDVDLSGYSTYSLLNWQSDALTKCISFSKAKRQASGDDTPLSLTTEPASSSTTADPSIAQYGGGTSTSSTSPTPTEPGNVGTSPPTGSVDEASTDGPSGTETSSAPTETPTSDAYTDSSDHTIDYNILQSLDGKINLHWWEDGNIYAISANDTTDANGENTADETLEFVSAGSQILGDNAGRLLHGYVDTLEQYGVSRLRFSDPEAVPVTSVAMSLVPAPDPQGGNDILFASTSAAEIYALVTCVFFYDDSLYPKVFLAKDVINGPKMLESDEVADTVTGGHVKSCGVIGYTNGSTDDANGASKKGRRLRKREAPKQSRQ